MYPRIFHTIRNSRPFGAIVVALVILAGLAIEAVAQAPAQLSLADIIVALRSKKVTLSERNKILTDAVLERGVTFALNPEIEKELEATGADKNLVGAIKTKSPTVNVSAVIPPAVVTKPPEYLAHQQLGDTDVARGEIDAAIIEYTKAIELKPTLAGTYLSRGRIYLTKGWYDNAIADFSKVIQLDPTNPAAFSNRGQAWEKKGDKGMAAADYVNVINLKPDDADAIAGLERLNPDTKSEPSPPLEKASQPNANPATPIANPPSNAKGSTTAESADNRPAEAAKTASPPDMIDLGPISTTSFVRLVKPIYSSIALKANIAGKVKVAVTLDEEGNVMSAKAIEGHQLLRQSSEEAARRSKFKPATYNGKPIRSTGIITYNYSAAGGASEE